MADLDVGIFYLRRVLQGDKRVLGLNKEEISAKVAVVRADVVTLVLFVSH